MTENIKRTARGRFAPGSSGNPDGGRCAARLMSPQRIDKFFEKHGTALLDRAFERFVVCDEVLSALLIFWGLRLSSAGGFPPASGSAAQ